MHRKTHWKTFESCHAERDISSFENIVDPDQLASSEASLSGSSQVSIQPVNP